MKIFIKKIVLITLLLKNNKIIKKILISEKQDQKINLKINLKLMKKNKKISWNRKILGMVMNI